jgi:hypothetical protein
MKASTVIAIDWADGFASKAPALDISSSDPSATDSISFTTAYEDKKIRYVL